MSDSPYDLNRAWWNERADFHLDTAFYGKMVAKLEAGGHCLLPLEVRELGSVEGEDLLHLQCHVGADSLSLARLGARVTGVDFSEVAIVRARELSKRLEIPARFEVCEISEVGARFEHQFDCVFTSYGAITWLSDLASWGRNIAQCLRSGGRFYVVDSHPLAMALDHEWTPADGHLRLAYGYLHQDAALAFEDPGSYAARDRATEHNSTREWVWSLSDVLNALMDAGLRIQWLREHVDGFYPLLPGMEEQPDGHVHLPSPYHGRYPLTFSVMACKD